MLPHSDRAGVALAVLEDLMGKTAQAVPTKDDLGSGLIDHIQKMTVAAIAIADMKVCAHRS